MVSYSRVSWLVLALVAGACCQSGFSGEYSVNQTDSFDYSINCNPEDQECNSLSLDEIASMVSNSNKTVTVRIDVRHLELTRTAKFSNVSTVAIRGSHSRLTCKAGNIGIEVLEVGDFHLDFVTIEGCGSTLETGVFISSALHITKCRQVTVSHATITRSQGTGLNLQRNTGNVLVEYSTFTDNSLDVQDSKSRHLGGNGVLVFIVRKNAIRGSEHRFLNCTFARNTAGGFRYDFVLSNPYSEVFSSRGRGGGMRVTITWGTFGVNVLVLNCTFEHNTAFLGAGLSAKIDGGGEDNAVIVRDTIFTGNGCQGNSTRENSAAGIGGGAYLSFEHLSSTDTNYINLTGVTFESNCAELGGGTYFFFDRSKTGDGTSQITFDDCVWRGNYAHTGSAVDITPNIFQRAQSGYGPTPVFRDCKFLENSIDSSVIESGNHHKERQSYGSGTLYASLTSIEFKSSVQFRDNVGSGIIIVNGAANFTQSDANFTGNRGIQGGALLLIGTATMIVGGGHNYTFLRNIASDKGGAIHSYLVDDTDFLVSRSCFIQYKDSDPKKSRDIVRPAKWDASMVFDGNIALRKGHSIYATSVVPCQVTRYTNPNKTSQYELIEDVGRIFEPPGIIIKNRRPLEIVTEGSRFEYMPRDDNILEMIPGKQTDVGVRILDDFGQEVEATLTAYIINNNNSSVRIDSEFSCITGHSIKLNGRVGDSDHLVLQTTGTRKISLTLKTQLLPCPPGFKLGGEGECECNSDAYVGIGNCVDNSALLTQGFWAGFVDDDGAEFGTSICPVGFCDYNGTGIKTGAVVLPERSSDLEEAVCSRERRGILCGRCREGFTTYYHSPNLACEEARPLSCRLGWLFYVLSELVPVTLLFLFVLALNISLTTGAVNGFILFSQVLDTLLIDASGVIKFPTQITALTRGYQVVYGFFTLDLFATDPLSFCLWENASVLDMLAFKYVTVAYSLLLVVSVILFMRYGAARCCGRYYSITALRNSVIHGLSGFLVLSYAQCIKVSFSLLYSQSVTLQKGARSTNISTSLNRVYLDGNIAFLSREHLAYAIPALLILSLVGVLPPLVLLGYPLLNKVFIAVKMEKFFLVRFLNRTSKLKPLLDSFQGSLKDNLRFFAGLYFFYRWVAVLTYAIVSQLSLFYTVVQALLILMLVVHSVCQPYQKHWHNILDTFLLADLVLINALTTLHYYQTRVDGSIVYNYTLTTVTMSVQVLLIYLPLVYITVYAAVRLMGKTCCKAVKDEPPSKQDFVLKKLGKRIYHSSITGSSRDSMLEDSLPYRLFNKDEDNPFEESSKEAERSITNSYL